MAKHAPSVRVPVAIGLAVVAVGVALLLALPTSPPSVWIREIAGTLSVMFSPSATVRGITIPLREGETARELTPAEADLVLRESAAGQPPLIDLSLGQTPPCTLITSSQTSLLMLCAPVLLGSSTDALQTDENAIVGMLQASVETQQERLSYADGVLATWYRIDETEQRQAARALGYTVGEAYPVIAQLAFVEVHACILDSIEGVELIGYAIDQGTGYLIWARADSRAELNQMFVR